MVGNEILLPCEPIKNLVLIFGISQHGDRVKVQFLLDDERSIALVFIKSATLYETSLVCQTLKQSKCAYQVGVVLHKYPHVNSNTIYVYDDGCVHIYFLYDLSKLSRFLWRNSNNTVLTCIFSWHSLMEGFLAKVYLHYINSTAQLLNLYYSLHEISPWSFFTLCYFILQT